MMSSGHRGLLFHNLVKQAANTPPKPYVDLLSDMAGARRREKEKADRKRRAKGLLKPAPNLPRTRPKRPGGAKTRLDDDAARRTPEAVQVARDGLTHRSKPGSRRDHR